MITVADSDGFLHFLHFFRMKLDPMSLQQPSRLPAGCLWKRGILPGSSPKMVIVSPTRLKCILKERQGIFHTCPLPPSETTFIVWTFSYRWPQRWGIVPCSIFVRRGFNTLILQGHRSLMLMWFSWGTLQNNMTLLRPLPLKSEFART